MNPILRGAPWLIAHRSMLGIDRPYKITLNGSDYVLWQNERGEISALDNICSHLQAPLSNGWICKSHNSIVCPYHALEFDREGRLLKDGEAKGEPVTEKLQLIIEDDLIWTYGGFESRLPIPDLVSQRIKKFKFLGIAGNTSIEAGFLDCIRINYDFNHQNGVHRDNFRIVGNPVKNFEPNGYQARVVQTFLREKNTLTEILQNPSLLTLPQEISNELEYSFPSTTLFKAQLPLGELLQFFILYPETEKRTRTFVLSYANWKSPLTKVPVIKNLIERSLVESTAKIVEQDSSAVESLYPRQKPKIKLPKEEIMTYVEELYHQWQ
ncbi:MAG: Rieske (2Fe-2S) protein [Pleurocapsa sp. MO_226.B13]|nr:Rieske (2Fe-2S) protein [Pleurocapsa sp. MO_226.B13]